jgi:hypothetical protein
MELKRRETVTTVNIMRRVVEAAAVTLKGVRRFWGEGYSGMVVRFMGRQGQGDIILRHTGMLLYF